MGAKLPVHAQERCEKQYGGEVICRPIDVTIDKKIIVPQEAWKKLEDIDEQKCLKDPQQEKCRVRNNFVLTDGYKFAPGQEVEFVITIKNVSKKTFGQVEIRDFLPEFLEPISEKSKEIKFEFKNFQPNEEKVVGIKAKVVSSDKLPRKQDIICDGRVTNKAEVFTDHSLFQSSDTAQVCVSKAANLKKLPETGPATTVLAGGLLVLVGITGIYLVKLYR